MPDTAPFKQTIRAAVPSVAAGATADQSIGEAPFAGAVTGVTYTPEADITGANTNTRTMTVVNKGQDGNGTTVVATLALTSGVNASDFDEKDFTLSVVAGATTVAAGDILAFVSTFAGTGIADPGGHVAVEITRS